MRREWIEITDINTNPITMPSPSMRREWIEILCLLNRLIHPESPSMRREWIEIAIMPIVLLAEMVSLHAEGVD